MNKEIWIVKIKGTEVACVYDDDAKAWRNAKRLAMSYGEIDFKHSTTLADFIKYGGEGWILTKESKTISIEADSMNPSFREINNE